MIEINKQNLNIFLEESKIIYSDIKKIAGDASFRSYYRIFGEEKNYILMFAPPKYEDMHSFIRIDEFLVNHNFSAPKIFAKNYQEGFLLLEDFGDDTYSRAMIKNNHLEISLYKNACETLAKLHQIKPKLDVKNYSNELLLNEVMLFVDWYLPYINQKINNDQIDEFKSLWLNVFKSMSKENNVLVLRDYHADNLMVLPYEDKIKSVGLLDFQDAVIGSKAYDLVSLLEDARRDVSEEIQKILLEFYLEKTNDERLSFINDYEILSLQRNLKILGIFIRLSIRDKKNQYLNFIPRVSKLVLNRLNSTNQNLKLISKFLKNFIVL